jgi:hypothetical protein
MTTNHNEMPPNGSHTHPPGAVSNTAATLLPTATLPQLAVAAVVSASLSPSLTDHPPTRTLLPATNPPVATATARLPGKAKYTPSAGVMVRTWIRSRVKLPSQHMPKCELSSVLARVGVSPVMVAVPVSF